MNSPCGVVSTPVHASTTTNSLSIIRSNLVFVLIVPSPTIVLVILILVPTIVVLASLAISPSVLSCPLQSPVAGWKTGILATEQTGQTCN